MTFLFNFYLRKLFQRNVQILVVKTCINLRFISKFPKWSDSIIILSLIGKIWQKSFNCEKGVSWPFLP